ncbi:hypothetical protein COJ90_21205 [Priestia megaterium]|nr:hypothetical protein COJ90_21205 [Priestia megaterium]
MRDFLNRLAKGFLLIDKTVSRIAKFLIDKPMNNKKENYYEKYQKEMPKKKYEETRFYLFMVYVLIAFLIFFVLTNAVRGLFH